MWNFEKYGEKIAVILDNGKQITYHELEEKGRQFFHVIGERCLIFILTENSIGSLVGYTASLNHKVVPVMVDGKLHIEMIENLINEYQPEYLWIPAERKNEFLMYGAVIYEADNYCLLKGKQQNGVALYKELALLLTTSGSTGSPKLVRQSYQNIEANTCSIISYLEITEQEKPITMLPMHYTYGLSVINTHLCAGATILLTKKSFIHPDFWRFFRENQGTSISGVPYTYEVLQRLKFFNMRLDTLASMTQAGGKLKESTQKMYAEYAKAQGKKFIIMYGQTEATARISYLDAAFCAQKIGSIGKAIPGGVMEIFDENGNKITEPDIIGELVYCGKNVVLGYAVKKEDLSKADEWNGILHTGDYARFDKEGDFYLLGRKDRYVKVYGNRINLQEVEEKLDKKYNATFVCLCNNDKISIFYEEAECRQDLSESKFYIAELMGVNPVAFQVIKLKRFPRTSTGKISYKGFEEFMK